MNSILIIAAHPDDEVLGCGGSIAKLSDKGAHVNVAFLADGVLSRKNNLDTSKDSIKIRREAAKKACEILGVKSVFFGEFPDNSMDTVPLLDIVCLVEELIKKYQPDTIFTHHSGDLNIDHRLTHAAVITACRPLPKHPVKTLLSFEVPSSTEWQLSASAAIFVPNWFIDISDTLDRKIAALDLYANELRDSPHPRSKQGVEYLARWRGASAGMNAAEAFMVGRVLI